MTGGDLSRPLLKPAGGQRVPHGLALSDDFRTLKLGSTWNFFKPSPTERSRVSVRDNALILKAAGTTPSDSRPLLLIPGDTGYEFECEVEIDPGVNAGLLLFYDEKLYCGLAFDDKTLLAPQYGEMRGRPEPFTGSAAADPHDERPAHGHASYQRRRRADLEAVRAQHGCLGLSPQCPLGFPEPEAGPVCGGHGRGTVPRFPVPRPVGPFGPAMRYGRMVTTTRR